MTASFNGAVTVFVSDISATPANHALKGGNASTTLGFARPSLHARTLSQQIISKQFQCIHITNSPSYLKVNFWLNWKQRSIHSLSFIRNAWKFYTVGVFWTLSSRSLFAFLNLWAYFVSIVKLWIQNWNFHNRTLSIFHF